MKRLSPVGLAVVTLAGLAAAGCGGPSVKQQGKLVDNGQPYTVEPSDTLQVTFSSVPGTGVPHSATAQAKPDGTFVVAGGDGKGLEPGKYLITVRSTKTGDPSSADSADKFKGKYSDPAKTPLSVDIPASNPPPIVIDVGKGTVTTGG